MALSLTEYNTSAAAAIAAGSKVEIAGAFFTFAGDETPTGWSSITTGNTAYIALTASGTAGSQIVNAAYTATAPTWRDDLQGWYASAASSVRIVASVYKAEATSYYPKRIIEQLNGSYKNNGVKIFISSGTFIVPNDTSIVWLTGCAAGGNGGSGVTISGSLRSGGGGGGGEIVYKKPIAVTPNSIVNVSIGSVGVNTSFGATSFNCGKNGTSASTSVSGIGGSGGSLINGSESGASGGNSGASGGNSSFSGGGAVGGGTAGGGGGASIGMFGYYGLPTPGGSSTSSGGAIGSFGGGGGGGSYSNSAAAAGNGGSGGYGGGGGGGGGNTSTGTAGTGGAGGPAVLIVEW